MTALEPAATATLVTVDDADGALRLVLTGRLDVHGVAPLWDRAVRAVEHSHPTRLVVDGSAVDYCDAVAAALFVQLRDLVARTDGTLEIRGFPDTYDAIIHLLLRRSAKRLDPPEREIWVERLGSSAAQFCRDCTDLVDWIGQVTMALAQAIVRPHTVRWRDTLRSGQVAGVGSFPVVVVVSLLLGLVMGFESALQLRRFGADLYLANLVGLSMVRELGPLMTAIVLTARSGSAFAAEIGTMRINEEVDALTTMGVHPVRFLVTPRVIAAVFMMPLLTMFAIVSGILGGGIVWVLNLDLPLSLYASQLEQAIRLNDVLGGLFKSLVFGILVAAIGCVRGLQTRGGPAAVGESTTRAVVSGIVLIAVTDSLFSMMYYLLGI